MSGEHRQHGAYRAMLECDVATLEQIQARWLEEVERRLDTSCSVGGLLEEMGRFHLHTGGKRLRALLPIWVCHNLGGHAQNALAAGVGLELLHNATLVHDDLQDRDEVRRGQPTVWRRWGDAQAINSGDALYFQGIGAIAAAQGLDAEAVLRSVRIASDALVRVIAGQAMEFQMQLAPGHPDRLEPSMACWLQMARGKTAALFGACLGLGAIAAGAPPTQVTDAMQLGEDIGLLFQMQDDYLDLVGEKGRERRASDLAEGKLSYPVLWASTHAEPERVARLMEIVSAPRPETTDALIGEGLQLLASTGALEATGRWLLQAAKAIDAHSLAKLVPGLCERILRPVSHALDPLV